MSAGKIGDLDGIAVISGTVMDGTGQFRGFVTVRAQGRVELARLEFGGLQPVAEGTRDKVLRVVREAFVPAPAPQRP